MGPMSASRDSLVSMFNQEGITGSVLLSPGRAASELFPFGSPVGVSFQVIGSYSYAASSLLMYFFGSSLCIG